MMERQVFEPDRIYELLRKDVVGGLRALADAAEAGELQVWPVGMQGNGFTSMTDARAHVLLTLNIASQVFRWAKVPEFLDAADRLELPDAVDALAGRES